jgi:bacteriocin-like protein
MGEQMDKVLTEEELSTISGAGFFGGGDGGWDGGGCNGSWQG